MPPKRASRSCADDLFRSKLDNIIDPLHELVQLGGLIVWPGFENAFGRFYRSASRPALPARLMVGLCYLKHAFDVGDERLLELGMMQALTRFEPDRSFRFATYATWWIKAAIREYVMRNRSLVRMGTTAAQKKLFFNLRRLKSELDELGESALQAANVKKIAEELGVSQDKVIEMNERLSARDQSLATPVGVDGDLKRQDMLESEGAAQDDAIAEASEFTWRRSLLAKGMSRLNERERHVLSERRLSNEPKTLNDLSEIHGVSRERIHQIEVRAFEKVQAATLQAAANRAKASLPA